MTETVAPPTLEEVKAAFQAISPVIAMGMTMMDRDESNPPVNADYEAWAEQSEKGAAGFRVLARSDDATRTAAMEAIGAASNPEGDGPVPPPPPPPPPPPEPAGNG